MNGKKKFIFVGVFLAAIVLILASNWHQKFLRQILELAANQNTKELFENSVRIGNAHLDRRLCLRIDDFKANFQSPNGPVPFIIRKIESDRPITDIFSRAGLTLHFDGARTQRSTYRGTKGIVRIKAGKQSFFELNADIEELGLEELSWLQPENLEGAKANLNGTIAVWADAKNEPTFGLELKSGPESGYLRAQTFNLLLSYLPQLGDQEKIQRLVAEGGFVAFRNATVKMDMNQPDRLKILFRMLILDYNLDLHFNIELKVDAANVFSEWGRITGLMKAKTE